MKTHRLAIFGAMLLAGTAPLAAQRSGRAHGSTGHAAAQRTPARTAAAAAHGTPRYGTFGVDLDARDPAIKPGDDFWRYANNRWFTANPIPADRTSWGTWGVLSEDVESQVRGIIQDANTRAAADPIARQVADLYASYMDEAGIEARGAAVLQPYLQQIAAARNRDDLVRLFAKPGFPSPIGIGITPSPDDPTHYIAGVGQGGLGMPNRDYYLNPGERFVAYRAAYKAYVSTMLRLAGFSDTDARADRIIALETQIAQAHWTPERSRDVAQSVNRKTAAELAALAPQFNIPLWLQGEGLANVQTFIVRQPSAVTAEAQLFESTPIDTWKDWLALHFIRGNANFLPHAFDDANFAFYGRTLSGQQQQRERWKRGLAVVNAMLGEAVGKLYVEQHFPAESRRQMDELVVNLRAALNERLTANRWMDEATRQQALAKLAAFDPRVGNPVRWIDYSSLRVDRADVLGNALRAAEFQQNLQLSRLPNPVDRSLWAMTPQTINAYYSPLSNQITFPAAILQPPFFDPNADPAVNYGAIGAVIGHEIGHGFDDQGSHYDPQGRLREWWTPEARQRFSALTTRLGAQYDSYEAVPGSHIKGQLTMGENIGDLGGIEMAYSAYHRYLAQHPEANRNINGLTPDQRFFLAFAQVWRTASREDALRQQVLSDPHSPPEFRVNGVVRNVDAWYRAFNVQPGDRMYLPPEQRIHIW